MAGDDQRGALFRPVGPNQHSRVTYAELFFDLVFVFAVTQISHTLLTHFTPLGAAHVAEALQELERRIHSTLFADSVEDARDEHGHD